MERDLAQLQIQVMEELKKAEYYLELATEIIDYITPRPDLIQDLFLTNSTYQEATKRIAKNIYPKDLPAFLLSIKQIKLMAGDILSVCKSYMFSA